MYFCMIAQLTTFLPTNIAACLQCLQTNQIIISLLLMVNGLLQWPCTVKSYFSCRLMSWLHLLLNTSWAYKNLVLVISYFRHPFSPSNHCYSRQYNDSMKIIRFKNNKLSTVFVCCANANLNVRCRSFQFIFKQKLFVFESSSVVPKLRSFIFYKDILRVR